MSRSLSFFYLSYFLSLVLFFSFLFFFRGGEGGGGGGGRGGFHKVHYTALLTDIL